MPRLFIAVDLPSDIQTTLPSLCQGLPGVRWLAPGHLHLTIRFIGEVDGGMSTAIRDGLTGGGLAAFACQLKGVGCFPSRGRPRVLWAGVQAEAGLFCLQAQVESALRRLGLPPEGKKFRPHITLTRLKAAPPPAAITEYLATHNQFQSAAFPVTRFHLYSSLLTAEGAIHRREHSYPLG